MEKLVNNLDVFMILRDQLKSLSDSKNLFNYLQKEINVTEENSEVLKKFCQKFCSDISARWKKSNRTLVQFIKRNGNWLESPINWPKEVISKPVNNENEERGCSESEDIENIENNLPSTSGTSVFTPRKPFKDLSNRQKRRRIEHINESFSPEELNLATTMTLRQAGNKDIGQIIDHLLKHPEDAEKIKDRLNISKEKVETYLPDKALAIYVSLKLSKWQYLNLRESAIEHGSDLYPSYYKVIQAKSKCYPEKNDILITEDGASVKIQALLNLTVSRLLDAIAFDLDTSNDLKLISKWGFDGASAQSNYKQKSETDFDDSSVFMASLVPIRLQQHDGTVVWENDRPSSTFYCRPIMFKFIKETPTTVAAIKSDITEQIEKLEPYKVEQVKIDYELLLTMIDGKIVSYLSETASSVCDICKAKPSEMNNLELIDKKLKDEDMYQYGLSSLHAWIRCMECILHIAYRLDFKKWKCIGDEDKNKFKITKSSIQEQFKKDCGLQIDIVKQGTGTTNDGNTARFFFRNSETTARITGISKNLVDQFYIILQTITSGERVDTEKFGQFCKNTAKLYVDLYPWYYMPSSVHKLLIHGAEIIQHFGLIPIGRLSEEAAEARNKDFRKYRENHSRKSSRTATNEDILHNLLLSSDPKITGLRPRMSKHNEMVLSTRARELLLDFPTEPDMEFIDVDNLQDSISDNE